MHLDDFTDFLDENGIEYRLSGRSIALQHCPECGSSQFKVLLRVVDVDEDEPFFGRCQKGKCLEGYSSVKYLIKMGVDYNEVLALHGLDPVAAYEGVANTEKKEKKTLKLITDIDEKEKVEEKVVSLDQFHNISAWPNHPATEYAKRRGITEGLYPYVKIDPTSNSVVFVCRNSEGRPVGWQKRFVKPLNPHMKTQTMPGFDKSRYLMEFEGPGPIVVCEGPFTATAAWQYGFHGVCTMGSSLSAIQLDKIAKLAEKTGKEIYVAAENDDAGNKAYKVIRSYFYWMGKPVTKLIPEVGKDLNDSYVAGKKFIISSEENWSGPSVPDVDFFGA